MKMNYSDMFDCISDKSAEILNEYEEYELDTVFSAVNTRRHRGVVSVAAGGVRHCNAGGDRKSVV